MTLPDLCIMDLSLPDLDGVAILGELAAQDYQGRILLISGHSQQLLRSVSRLAEDYRLKIIGCVRKPFTIKPLLEALDAYPSKTFVPTREDVVQAIRNEEIVVRYQPIVDLARKRDRCGRSSGALAASNRGNVGARRASFTSSTMPA